MLVPIDIEEFSTALQGAFVRTSLFRKSPVFTMLTLVFGTATDDTLMLDLVVGDANMMVLNFFKEGKPVESA